MAWRPGSGRSSNKLEIFQTSRPVTALAAGMTLRVVDTARFRMVYSMDGWETNAVMESKPVGYAGFYADIPTAAGRSGHDRVHVLLAGAGQVAGPEL